MLPGVDAVQTIATQTVAQHDQTGLFDIVYGLLNGLPQILRNGMQAVIEKGDGRVLVSGQQLFRLC